MDRMHWARAVEMMDEWERLEELTTMPEIAALCRHMRWGIVKQIRDMRSEYLAQVLKTIDPG